MYNYFTASYKFQLNSAAVWRCVCVCGCVGACVRACVCVCRRNKQMLSRWGGGLRVEGVVSGDCGMRWGHMRPASPMHHGGFLAGIKAVGSIVLMSRLAPGKLDSDSMIPLIVLALLGAAGNTQNWSYGRVRSHTHTHTHTQTHTHTHTQMAYTDIPAHTFILHTC